MAKPDVNDCVELLPLATNICVIPVSLWHHFPLVGKWKFQVLDLKVCTIPCIYNLRMPEIINPIHNETDISSQVK